MTAPTRPATSVMSAPLSEIDPVIADVIATAPTHGSSVDITALRRRVTRLAREFPLYGARGLRVARL